MAKKELTEEQKIARRERAKARREKRKAAAAAAVTPDTASEDVKNQVTEATSEDDILAPVKSEKKAKKSKRERKAEREAKADNAQKFLLFKDTDSLKDFAFHRFTDNDNFKTAYYLESCNGKNLMRGTFVKITAEGKIDPSDYSKLEAAENEDGFIGWIKDPSYNA